MTIDAAGNLTFEQHGYGGIVQKGTAKVTRAEIKELVAAINKANVWAIEDNPFCTQCGIFEGLPPGFSITLNGRHKSVSGWGICLATPEPGTAPCELLGTIHRITDWRQWIDRQPVPPRTLTPAPSNTPVPSNAKVVVTVYMDVNGNGTPEPTEGLTDIPVQLSLPDGKILSATTQRGIATFDMSGCTAGIQITVSLPKLYRNQQFSLPQSGTVPVVFSFAQPTLPGKTP